MYQGFKYYYKKGLKNSFKTFKKAKNSFKFLMFLIIQLITLPLVFLLPITCNARINLSKQIKEDHKISVVKAFDNTRIGQVYWKIILAVLLELLVWFAGLAAIVLVTYPVIMIAQTLGVAVYVTIVAIIIAVIYTILILLYSIPVVYVISTKPEYSYAEAVYTGMRMLKKKGKFAIIFNEILSIIWLIPVGIAYIFYLSIRTSLTPLGVIVFGVGICVITLIFIFFYIPFVINTNIVTLYCMFEDLIKEEKPLTFNGFKVKNIKYLEEKKYKNQYLEKLFEIQNLDLDSVTGIEPEENKNKDKKLSKKQIKKLEKANKKAEKEKEEALKLAEKERLALEKKLAKENKKAAKKEEKVVEEKNTEKVVNEEIVLENKNEEIVINEEVVLENKNEEMIEEVLVENNTEIIAEELNNEEIIVEETNNEEVVVENENVEEKVEDILNEEVVEEENNEEVIVEEINNEEIVVENENVEEKVEDILNEEVVEEENNEEIIVEEKNNEEVVVENENVEENVIVDEKVGE